MKNLLTSLRFAAASIAICCILYTLLIWCIAQIAVPEKANGQLLRDKSGRVIGSRMIGQNFTSGKYFHGRPSKSGCGSNFSPASPELRKQLQKAVKKYHAATEHPLPAELAMGSGSGLDPHITREGAMYQIARIAAARKIPVAEVEKLVEKNVFYPCPLLHHTALVNVLELNQQLDTIYEK